MGGASPHRRPSIQGNQQRCIDDQCLTRGSGAKPHPRGTARRRRSHEGPTMTITTGLSITSRRKPFDGRPMIDVVRELTDEIQELYLADEVPWVIGYSGGKDSTAVLQLIWLALQGLEADQRTKPVYVISTDTLVENPVVAAWVTQSLETMRHAAEEQHLPIQPNRLTPAVKDTFWVGVIGKGYPAPRPKFRWCTERLKIRPSNDFIRRVVRQHGEAILVLGIRKAESQA